MATIVKCTDCGVRLRRQTPFDLCSTCQSARVLYGDDIGKPLPPVEEETPRLKLFKVTIPSQTINQEAALRGTDKWVVGEIKDYGFIQGREIFVLATDRDRLYKQCLRELGCTNPADVELKVEELEGPFEHGYVIAYNQPDGL